MYHEHVAVTVLSTTSDIQACLEQGIARDLMQHPVRMVPGIAVTSFFVSFLCPVCSRFAAE